MNRSWKPPGMREAKTNGPKKKCQNQTDDVRRKTASIFIEIIVGSSSGLPLRSFLLKQAGGSIEMLSWGLPVVDLVKTGAMVVRRAAKRRNQLSEIKCPQRHPCRYHPRRSHFTSDRSS